MLKICERGAIFYPSPVGFEKYFHCYVVPTTAAQNLHQSYVKTFPYQGYFDQNVLNMLKYAN